MSASFRIGMVPAMAGMMLLLGCHSHGSTSSDAFSAGPHYILRCPGQSPQTLQLSTGDRISVVLSRDCPTSNASPMTLVLVRHGPEWMTRELIELDARGKLLDEKQDYVLRDGDELVFPPAH